MDIVILIVAFVVILFGAELFTNGIEWFGRKLELAEGAVGSVLAAVGTALPETMIPIIAILFASGEASHAVGIGAILGAPFMLATLAMFVTGVAVLSVGPTPRDRRRDAGRHGRPRPRHALLRDRLRDRDRRGVPAARTGLAEVDRGGGPDRDLRLVRQGPLRGRRRASTPRTSRRCASGSSTARPSTIDPAVPRLRVVNLQVLAALGLIIIGAVFFVDAVEHLATTLGIDGALLALVIAPIATELPEKFNSVIWVRQGKDTLAMGNITGAMVFQSTIPTVVALLFASNTWVAAPRLVHRVRLGRHRLPVVGVHLHPDGPPRRPARPGSARRRRLLPGLPGARDRGRGRHVRLAASPERPDVPPRRRDILRRPQHRSPRMLTEKVAETPSPKPHHAPAAGSLDELICYFEGDWVPMRDAKVSIMTHAFMYGTATFEGIRAYWNAEQETLYGLKLREHVERLRQSCRILLMKDVPSVDELTGLIVETVRRNGFREDAYIRPSFYKSTKAIGVRLHNLENELYIVALPFGNYIDTEAGVRVMTSSWRRNADEALPARGKIVGGYVNMAFQKSEAELNGFDEALVLTADGHVNEASAANLFVVRDGVALTPPVSDDLLEGVTRKALMELLATRASRSRALDRPVRAVRRRRGLPVRDRRPGLARSSRSITGRSARARSARSAGWSATATSTPCAGGSPSTATG